VRGNSDAAIIQPTGSGKSLLYMLLGHVPALGVTIVILPLISLLNDVATHCQQQHVPHSTWTDMNVDAKHSLRGRTPLVFAMPEQAALLAFRAWAAGLAASHQLHGVILDDTHLMLADVAFWRQLLPLRHLQSLGCPWSVMSASLAPSALLDLAHLLVMPNLHLMRSSVNQPELAYDVVRLTPGEQLHQQAQQLLHRQLQVHATAGRSGWRAIIFCCSQELCCPLASDFGAPALYDGVDEREQAHALAKWRAGAHAAERLLFSVTALGAPLDYRGVRLIVHVGPAASATAYADETGRAGRDGQPAQCVTLVPPAWQPRPLPLHHSDWEAQDRATMRALFCLSAPPQPCHWQALTAYLDGNAKAPTCQASTEQLCDLCGTNSVLPPPSTPL
jgi:superfamily II DNA helicase RecQ